MHLVVRFCAYVFWYLYVGIDIWVRSVASCAHFCKTLANAFVDFAPDK